MSFILRYAMSSPLMDSLIEELNKKLGDSPLITTRQLISCGIYGSLSAARQALREGRLPFIKISLRRFVVPREELLNFLLNNFAGK